jgi:hypothetical protein
MLDDAQKASLNERLFTSGIAFPKRVSVSESSGVSESVALGGEASLGKERCFRSWGRTFFLLEYFFCCPSHSIATEGAARLRGFAPDAAFRTCCQ